MAQSTLAGKIIGILFVVLVVPFAIYGLWRQNNNNTVVSNELNTSVLVPYAKAVQEHRYADAYNTYTSNTFKTTHSLTDFEAAQAKNIADYGEMVELEKRTDIIEEIMTPESPTVFRTTRLYTATNKNETVVYEFEKEGDMFKLRETYISTGREGKNAILVPRIF